MQTSTRAQLWRTSAACAAAAILIGGTLTAGTASAAPPSEPPPTATASAGATAAAPSAALSGAAPLPGGLAEALDRDLGMSLGEFNAQGALATQASAIQAQVSTVDPAAVVTLTGDTIAVQTSAAAVAKAAAGNAKVDVTAPTTSTVSKNANNVDTLYADYVSTFGAENLLSVARNAAGEYVIRTGEPNNWQSAATPPSSAKTLEPSIADFAAKYTNVVVEEASGPATPTFEDGDPFDVVNGQGYAAFDATKTNAGLCSTGWNGFNKAGAPAIVSAGHCTMDGFLTEAYLTNPMFDLAATGDPAVEAQLLTPPAPPAWPTPQGHLGFSQFGGPGNSTTMATPDGWHSDSNIGTDVSVIDNIPDNFTQAPTVAKWTGAAAWTEPEQISTDSTNVKVTAVASPVLGAPVCKSGRTTGWTCGTVDEIGAYAVAGINYPSEQNPNGDPLDIRAVRGFASFSATPLSDHGDSGGPVISGTAAVGITSGGGQMTDGQFVSIAADLKTALAATDGYTVKIFLNAPTVTTTGQVFRKGTITGTVAGAPAGTTVSVTIDGVAAEVPVGTDGKWTATAPNKFGTFAVTAHATNDFSTSATTTASIEVIKDTLAAPAITSLANGQKFAFNRGPSVISGTNLAQATVRVSVDGRDYNAVVVGTTWSVTLANKLTTGNYAIAAVQQWGGVQSLSSSFTITVLAEPAPPATQTPTAAPTTAPTKAPVHAADLATTGASGSLLLLGGAGVLLLLGGAAFLLIRRRNVR